MLTGTVDADTTIRNYAAGVTVDSLDFAGRVNLTQSSIGRLAIESASRGVRQVAAESADGEPPAIIATRV